MYGCLWRKILYDCWCPVKEKYMLIGEKVLRKNNHVSLFHKQLILLVECEFEKKCLFRLKLIFLKCKNKPGVNIVRLLSCIKCIGPKLMSFQVFMNISSKRQSLPAMSSARRLHYEGIIYRFKVLMLATLLCAAMTVIGFILGQVSSGICM